MLEALVNLAIDFFALALFSNLVFVFIITTKSKHDKQDNDEK